MDNLFEAIKLNDLVAVRKYFAENMGPICDSLIKERKIEIARSFLIEGEEPEDEDEDEDEDKADKKESDEEPEDDEEDDE